MIGVDLSKAAPLYNVLHVTRGWRVPWGVAVTHGEVQRAEVACQPRYSQTSTSLNVSPHGLPQSATAPVFPRWVPKLPSSALTQA